MHRTATAMILLAEPARADPEGYGHGDGHMMDWGFGFMFGPVLWLIVLGAVVAGVIWLVRGTDSGRTSRKRGSAETDALAALNMRLAKGEIDEDEYRARKKLLTS